jgi:stringent starvation protein B
MSTLPSKKEVLLNLLEKSSVLMHLDARREDVHVPRNLKTNPQLILQLGLNLPVPIRDLEVGDDGVKCTLSFQRVPFYCVLPYPAIFAMVSEDGRAMVWPEDVPGEVARAAEEEARKLGLTVPKAGADAGVKTLKSARDAASPPKPTAVGSAPKRPREELKSKNASEPKRAPKPKPAPAKPQQDAPRTKRELPPYLRVIK